MPKMPMTTRVAAGFRTFVVAMALMLPTVATQQLAMAQPQGEDDDKYDDADGRLRGYEDNNVVMPESSVALTYFAFIGLTVLAAGVMFKAAKRTHLD